MITDDYRNTEYCPKLENVEKKKKTLEEKIKKAHPRQKIMYNKIHKRNTDFHTEFCHIYNCKCAYCGASMDVLPAVLFEVDHFVAESTIADKVKAGETKNLVLSCYQCNRNKKEFEIKGEYIEILNTDSGKIADVFLRTDDYYIRIKDDYAEDETINNFYDKLQLIHQTRRLDYLLMNMQGLHKKLEGTIQGGKLAEAIVMLQRKRNQFAEGNVSSENNG